MVLIGRMLFNISNFGEGVKFYATLKMQGVTFYLKNVKRGNVFIVGCCKGVKILFFHFFRKPPPPRDVINDRSLRILFFMFEILPTTSRLFMLCAHFLEDC